MTYSKPKGVIIWLGEERSTDMEGLELMHRLYHAAFEQQQVDFKLVPSNQYPRFGLPVLEDPVWTAVWPSFDVRGSNGCGLCKNFFYLCFALGIIGPNTA